MVWQHVVACAWGNEVVPVAQIRGEAPGGFPSEDSALIRRILHGLQQLFGCLQVVWRGLFEQQGVTLPPGFDMATLAFLSDGYAPGTLKQVYRPT